MFFNSIVEHSDAEHPTTESCLVSPDKVITNVSGAIDAKYRLTVLFMIVSGTLDGALWLITIWTPWSNGY